jgi:hypothetical protein
VCSGTAGFGKPAIGGGNAQRLIMRIALADTRSGPIPAQPIHAA